MVVLMTSRPRPAAPDTARGGSTAQKMAVESSGGRKRVVGASSGHHEAVMTRRKYGNQPTVVNGKWFDSKKEANRYAELVAGERAGLIHGLEVHPRFPLVVNGQDCGVYVGDFAYVLRDTGERVIEDVKSAPTRKLPTYRLKARLVWALFGLRVREV